MTGEELQKYKMSPYERKKWAHIQNRIKQHCKESVPAQYYGIVENYTAESVYYEHYAGYCKEEGYYYIAVGDHGDVYMLCKTESEEVILCFLMEKILRDIGMRIELKIREQEQRKWMYYTDDKMTEEGSERLIKNENYVYHTKYDSRKWWFEYIIRKLRPFFNDSMMNPIEKKYTDYMNKWFGDKHWEYNRSRELFEEMSDSVEQDSSVE